MQILRGMTTTVRLRSLLIDGEGDAPATVEMMLERSLDGEEWVIVAEGLEPGATVGFDFEAVSHGETFYRVTAYASTGASAEFTESLFTESWAVWLSGGTGFVQTGTAAV